MAPCRAERVNLPWTFPCPSLVIVSRAAAAASRSSLASFFSSSASATSGARVARMPLPRTRSSRGARCAASATSTSTALAGNTGSRSSGRSSTARTITSACSTFTSPAPSPTRTGSNRSVSERLGQPHQAEGRGPVLAGLVRPPVRRRRGCDSITYVQGVGVDRDPQLELRQPRLDPGQRGQRVGGFLGTHRPQRHLRHVIQHSGHAATARDTGWRSGVWSAAMTPIQAVTTDSQTPIWGFSTVREVTVG